ncbi:MAG: hypothetical protein HFE59_06185 [Clostridiales bacterium]|nr:hypothetical protein [Clostridiales bacterium]
MKYVIDILLMLFFILGFIFADIKFKLISKKVVYIPLIIIIGLNIYSMIFIKGMSIYFAVIYLAVEFILTILSFWDIKEKEIPVIYIYCLLLCCGIMMLINPYCDIINNIITGIIITVVLALFYRLKKESVGLGDIEVIAALSFSFGYPHIFNILFTALFISMIFGIILLIIKRAKLKTEIPFIPFLCLSVILNIINF